MICVHSSNEYVDYGLSFFSKKTMRTSLMVGYRQDARVNTQLIEDLKIKYDALLTVEYELLSKRYAGA